MTRDMKKYSEWRNRITSGRRRYQGSAPTVPVRVPSSAGANQQQPQQQPSVQWPLLEPPIGSPITDFHQQVIVLLNDLNERITAIEDTIGLALEE